MAFIRGSKIILMVREHKTHRDVWDLAVGKRGVAKLSKPPIALNFLFRLLCIDNICPILFLRQGGLLLYSVCLYVCLFCVIFCL